jgi:hypothetical protein
MTRCLLKITRLIICLLVVISARTTIAVNAQVPGGDGRQPVSESKKDAQGDALQRRQQDALKLLNKLITEATEIDDSAVRARVLTRLADALWDRDETQARALFQMAYDDSGLITSAHSDSDLIPSVTCATVRSLIIRIVSRRDPKFAHKLSAHLTQDNSCSFGPRGRYFYGSDRADLIVWVARTLARKDPVTAERLGRQSLNDGIASSIPDLLKELRVSDVRRANELTYAAITKIAKESVNGYELQTIGNYLLEEEEADNDDSDKPEQEKKSDTEKKEANALITRFLDATLSATSRLLDSIEQKSTPSTQENKAFSEGASNNDKATNYFAALTKYLPSIERHLPARLAIARNLIERLGHWLDPATRAFLRATSGQDDITPDSLVAQAEASTEIEIKDSLYHTAASMTVDSQGNLDKALSIASRINDPVLRGETLEHAWSNRVSRAISEGKYAEAEQLASEIPKLECRIYTMKSMIHQIDKTRAVPLLEKLTATLIQLYPEPAPEQAQMMMEIAWDYASIDPERGFIAMQRAIKAMNAAAGNPIDEDRRWELRLSVTSPDPLSLAGDNLNVFNSLGEKDYFRSLQLARTFEDKSLSIVAQLIVLRSVLSIRQISSGHSSMGH